MKPLTLVVIVLALLAASSRAHAESHKFVPTVFHNTFSSAHAPVLRIKSGERVITATVDEAGVGADGKTVAQGPNPVTGPFYIEGAEPGDLIVVSIEKLQPNRTTGMSPSFMAASSFDPGALANKPAPAVPWSIDLAKGVVRLDLQGVIPNVKWGERYSPATYELPLRPVLGSIGVAPANKASANIPGPFGGKLDCAGVTAGAKVLLPVYQPGALLFLGHGLARVGDAETTGAGIETSMDVEFSVELVKKKEWPHSSVMRPSTIAGEFPIEWPRIETGDYVMAVGSAPSLLEALQHATSELHHWLDDDFGFSERSLSIFLGQAIEYDVAHVADQNVTVAAKVRKSYLPREAK